MWGSKRKREEAEAAAAQVQADGGFETSRRAAAAALSSRDLGGSGATESGGRGGLGSKQFGDQIRLLIETYVDLMEKAIMSPEFASNVTPETVKTMLDQVPGLADNPQIAAVINSPEFTDPDKLLETVRSGISALKMYTNDIVAMLNDPQQVSQMLDQLPVEYQGVMRRLMDGDKSALEDLIEMAPNLTHEARKMMRKLLDGDMAGVISETKSMLKGPKANSQIEDARQMLLNNPEMLAQMGLDISTVSDPAAFQELMSSSMDQLMNMAEGGDAGDEVGESRLFSGSQAA